MFGLGGRSAAWDLFSPRVHDEILQAKFALGSELFSSLLHTWYPEVEALMKMSLPAATSAHQHVMGHLNMVNDKKHRSVQWQWGRIASKFHENHNFDFAKGALSTIDKALEIAMSTRSP